MSLTHEFYLLSSDFDINARYEWYKANRYTWTDKSELSDVIIQYMMDFLNWVPSYNPETKENDRGLNYYGVTVIYKAGAETLVTILEKWLILLEEAPDTFSIRGDTVWKEQDNDEGYWEQKRNWIQRETMRSELEALIHLAAIASKNDQLIIHFGI